MGFDSQFTETGREVHLTSKFFRGTGTNLNDQYTLPQGYIVKATSDLEPIPEPSTLLLLGSSLAGLGGVAWRRHRRN